MWDRVISLQHTLSDLGSSLVAEHVSGERNVVADHLSRVDVGDAFQLNQFVFADLQCTIGPCTINCFATMANALLPVLTLTSWSSVPPGLMLLHKPTGMPM